MAERSPVSRATRLARALSALGLVASCVPMVAMLPGAVAGVLGLVGFGASSSTVAAAAPVLDGVAQPLLLVSAALLAVGGLRCGGTAVTLAAVGGVLLYLSMYVVTGDGGSTSPVLFYVGLALFLSAYVNGWRRQRRTDCQPLVDPQLGGRLLAGTLVLGVLVIAVSAAADGASDVTRHSPEAAPHESMR